VNFYTSERILKCAGYCFVRLETDDSEEPTIANDDVDGWMDGRMDGWMDGGMDGWMDGGL
jgi:rhodanese-related sulfurtransferase